jgi:hypothetical protein
MSLVVAILATSIGSMLLPLGFSISRSYPGTAGIAANLWAVLLMPSICFVSLSFSPDFIQSRFRFVMALGFLINVMTWTLILYGVGRVVAKFRSRHNRASIGPT